MRVIYFILFCFLLIGCTKTEVVAPKQEPIKHKVRVEISGDDTEIMKHVEIGDKVSQDFTGNFSYEYETAANSEQVDITITSDHFFTNSISLYADDELAVQRAGDCLWKEYSLNHNLRLR